MKKIYQLAGVWGAGVLALIIFYFIKGGEITGIDIGAGKVFVFIVGGVLYGTYKVLNTKSSD
jgi:hypothetical protein